MEKCKTGLWGDRVEQGAKSWNTSERKVKQETSVVILAQRLQCLQTKPFPHPLLFYLNTVVSFYMSLSTLCIYTFF
jgi:hypothetical protein